MVEKRLKKILKELLNQLENMKAEFPESVHILDAKIDSYKTVLQIMEGNPSAVGRVST